MLNKATLIGRLTKDPEIRYTSDNQTAVAKFTIAVDRTFKKDGQPSADFIPIIVFGKSAENVGKYVKKGRLVAVSGKIQTRSWDGNDGKKCYATEVISEEVDYIDKAKAENDQREDFYPSDENQDLPF